MRHNIGPISAAKSRLLLLGQYHCLHLSSAGPTTAAFFGCLNLPTFSRNLAQYRPYTKLIVIFTMVSSSESRRARVGLMNGTLLGHVSLLPRQTILEVIKLEFGTALARCCVENKCWRPEFGPELAAKCKPELSFQQRHDIGNRSSEIFWRCWASVGPYLTSHLGSSHYTRRWLFFLFEDNQWKSSHVHPKKLDALMLPANGIVFAFFRDDSPTSVHCCVCTFILGVKWWIDVSSTRRIVDINGYSKNRNNFAQREKAVALTV